MYSKADEDRWYSRFPKTTTVCYVSAAILAIFLAMSYMFGWISIRVVHPNDPSPLFGRSVPTNAGGYAAAASSGSGSNVTETEGMFGIFDENVDGLLQLPEFQVLLHSQIDETSLFEFIDFNGDGVLTGNEVVVMLEHIHDIEAAENMLVQIEDGMMEELFGYTYTRKEDGSVDQKYFEYNAQFVMYQFDQNRDGQITLEDWKYYFAYDFFYVFDDDGDGAVSLNEFMSAAAQFESSDELSEFGLSDVDLTSVIPSRDVLVSEAANFVYETSMDELYAVVEEIGEDVFEDMGRRRLWGWFKKAAKSIVLVTTSVVLVTVGIAVTATGNPGGLTLVGAGLTVAGAAIPE